MDQEDNFPLNNGIRIISTITATKQLHRREILSSENWEVVAESQFHIHLRMRHRLQRLSIHEGTPSVQSEVLNRNQRD